MENGVKSDSYREMVFRLGEACQTDPYVAIRLIEISVSKGKYKEALLFAGFLEKMLPEEYTAYHARFSVMMLMSDFAGAGEIIRKSEDKFKTHIHYINDKLLYLIQFSGMRSAGEYLEETHSYVKEKNELYLRLSAQIYCALNDGERAFSVLNTLHREFDAEYARIVLALLQFEKGDYDNALLMTEMVLSGNSLSRDYYLAMLFNACIYHKTGAVGWRDQVSRTAGELDETASKKPENIWMLQAAAYLWELVDEVGKSEIDKKVLTELLKIISGSQVRPLGTPSYIQK